MTYEQVREPVIEACEIMEKLRDALPHGSPPAELLNNAGRHLFHGLMLQALAEGYVIGREAAAEAGLLRKPH